MYLRKLKTIGKTCLLKTCYCLTWVTFTHIIMWPWNSLRYFLLNFGKITFGRCSKISNTSCLPSYLPKRPRQTMQSQIRQWSVSSLFAILTSILGVYILITNILFQNWKRKVLEILIHLQHMILFSLEGVHILSRKIPAKDKHLLVNFYFYF